MMDARKRAALEAAGWKLGDAADFLGMSDQEHKKLEHRLFLALIKDNKRLRCALEAAHHALGVAAADHRRCCGRERKWLTGTMRSIEKTLAKKE